MNSQYDKFSGMMNDAVEHDFHKLDFVSTCRQMSIEDNTTILVNNKPYELEQDAFTQMVKIISPVKNGRNNSIAIADYLWHNKSNGIFQYALDKHLNAHPNQEFLVRTYDSSIRAFLSPNYAVMNNASVIMQVAAIINDNKMVNEKFRVVESNVSRDSMRVKLLFTEYDAGQYGTGIYVTNNELGNGSVAFHSLVKRASCDNSLISADNMALYHRGDIYNRLNAIEPELIASVNHSGNLLKLLYNSRHITFTPAQLETVIETIKDRYLLTDEFVEYMVDGMEGENNLFGIVNGITYAAKQYKDREHYEQIAAKLLDKYLK